MGRALEKIVKGTDFRVGALFDGKSFRVGGDGPGIRKNCQGHRFSGRYTVWHFKILNGLRGGPPRVWMGGASFAAEPSLVLGPPRLKGCA